MMINDKTMNIEKSVSFWRCLDTFIFSPQFQGAMAVFSLGLSIVCLNARPRLIVVVFLFAAAYFAFRTIDSLIAEIRRRE